MQVSSIYSSIPIAVFGLICGGCSTTPDFSASGLHELSEIQRAAIPSSQFRAPAQTNSCFFERFVNPDMAEIQSAEADSLAMPESIRGQRNKIFEYFKGRIDGYVHPKFAADLRSCADTLCFYQRVYGSTSSAKLAYLVFLKTGMAVSASDAVPNVTSRPSEQGTNLSEFLFSDQELKMILESSESITSSRYSLFVYPRLRTLHRVPTTVLRKAESESVRNSCGFASGSYIVIQSNCLGSDWPKRVAERDFSGRQIGFDGNDVYLHEVGHCVDMNIGLDPQPSDSSDWVSLSRLLQQSADGTIHYPGEAPEGFVSGYAATSYAEDFAETFAHYRLRPEKTRTRVTAKYEYLKKHVFNGREFTQNTTHEYLATAINSKILQDMNRTVAGCIGRHDTVRKAKLYQTTSLSEGELACVEAEAFKIAGESFRAYRRTSPEGCYANESDWTTAMLTPAAATVSKSIGTLETVGKLAVLREQMTANMDPKEVYLEARKRADAKEYYTRALNLHFEKFRNKFNTIDPDLGAAEQKNYLARFDFEVVQNTVRAVLMEQLKSLSAEISPVIESSFQSCIKSTRVSAPIGLLKRDFRPTAEPEFIKCGRRSWEKPLLKIVTDVVGSSITTNVSHRAVEFAFETADAGAEDRYRQRIEEEMQKLEKVAVADATVRLKPTQPKPVPLAQILAQPLLEREDTCRGVVRKMIYDDVYRHSNAAALATYTESLIALEVSYCEDMVDRNVKHRAELETLRNQIARFVYSVAFRLSPKQFPQDETIFPGKESPVQVVDPAIEAKCVEMLSTASVADQRLSELLKSPRQAKLISAGVRETCLNGRYAGRFNWTPSDRFIEFGGVRSLGFAQFYTTTPTGAEARTYLYSLRRYIQFRTSEKMQMRLH